jgi:alkylation response protein AidB-like acyl-CoA dehydrogenase
MNHYRSNVDDIAFNLFEVLGIDRAQQQDGPLDRSTVVAMLRELDRLAAGPIAASYTSSDRRPPAFDANTHTVSLPEDLKASVRTYLEAGWAHVGADSQVGGTEVPQVLRWALAELVLAANPAVYMYATAPTSASIFLRQATAEQQGWARVIGTSNWGSTMVLTEADAGSDVGAARTKAIPQLDGTWHIEGVKRFITSADSGDLFDNIVHFVLARPQGARAGTKGLSLFLVPKFHVDFTTGALGERNGVFVTNLESKMGLKASATCELAFGQHGIPAVGWLVGETHDGVAQIFDVIEDARMFVGTKAVATLSAGYLNALSYAKTRIQGGDLAHGGATAPRVAILRHPDVRRSLLTQKAYVEGLRALYLFAAAHQDAPVAAVVTGADPSMAAAISDMLLPIVKGFGAETAIAMLNEALQVFGGSGYLQDYPLEQYIRDARIDALYEGTTAIQAQDLLFRKIVRNRGAALGFLSAFMKAELDQVNDPPLKPTADRIAHALREIDVMNNLLLRRLTEALEQPEQIYLVGLDATGYLYAMGDLLVGWMLLRHAVVSSRALVDPDVDSNERAFFEGKIAAAAFFADRVLPRLSATRKTFEATTLGIMHLPDEAF